MSRYLPIFNKKRNVILFIFDYSCVLCGLVNVNNHVHHNDRNRENNDGFNLFPLCHECHKLAHKTGIVLQVSYTERQLLDILKLNKYH